MTVILIILFFVIFIGIVRIMLQKEKKKWREKAHKQIQQTLKFKGLAPDHLYFTPSGQYPLSISINEEQKKVSFGDMKDGHARTKEYFFKEIIGYKVQINNQFIKEVSWGGAAIGGVIAGGTGALIGSLMGNEHNEINSIHLLLTVENLSQPLIRIPMYIPLDETKGWDKKDPIHQGSPEQVNLWSSIFDTILKMNQKE